MDLISVIIPVYNTAQYLRKCVDSVLAQTWTPLEVLLVDDGSMDGSAEICDEYAAAYPDRVRAIHQPNGGSSAARNSGIREAAGDFLGFIDSDDYIDADMYARLMRLLTKYDADMAAIEMWVEKTPEDRFCRVNSEMERCWTTEEALVELNSYRYLHKSFCTALFRRQAIGELRFPEGTRSEDYSLLYQVVAQCGRVAYASDAMYHYVQRYGSNSRTQDICLAPMRISQEQIEFFRKNFPRVAFAAETDCAFEHMGIYTAYIRNGLVCPKTLLRELRRVARRYLGSVLRNRSIPRAKKLQAVAFCGLTPLYRFVIARTEHR